MLIKDDMLGGQPMRAFVTITTCAAVALLTQGPLQAQKNTILTGLPKATVTVDSDALLNSSPGCARQAVAYADLAKTLTAVAGNRKCKFHVALAPRCTGKKTWINRQIVALPDRYTQTPTISASEQNGLIALARADAQALPVPAGKRLYQLNFPEAFYSGGPLPFRPVKAEAHFGVCGIGHN